ncbi:MAG: thiolase family protein [Planctomycetota bacterium]
MAMDVVIVGSARTPIGGFCGALTDVSAPALGSTAVRAALERSGVAADQVDEVIFGNVLGAGLGQNVARQVSIGAGMAPSVGAATINKVCGSGLKAVMMAAQTIQCGDADLIVAGGTESMSRAPYLLPKARAGYRMGNGELIDSLITDGLWDVYNNMHMGTCGDRCAERYSFSRQGQDDFAVASYQRARKAQSDGSFASEIAPVEIAGRKGTVTVEQDEGPARFDEEKLRRLSPAFGKEGTITAGNASSINDGAAAVVVASAEKAAALSVKPVARIVGYSSFSREPEWFTLAPIGSLQRLLDRVGWSVADVDLFEINEAFAVVPMAAMKELGIPHEKVNIHGGAVALGHPIGASGARVLVTLLGAMRARGAKRGVASLCIGGGEAVAMAIEAG